MKLSFTRAERLHAKDRYASVNRALLCPTADSTPFLGDNLTETHLLIISCTSTSRSCMLTVWRRGVVVEISSSFIEIQ